MGDKGRAKVTVQDPPQPRYKSQKVCLKIYTILLIVVIIFFLSQQEIEKEEDEIFQTLPSEFGREDFNPSKYVLEVTHVTTAQHA